MASPLNVMGEATPLAMTPGGDEVTVYEVIGDPPLETGAVNETVACALPGVATPMMGAPGTVEGVTLLEGGEAGPVPTPVVAVTVNV